MLQRGKKKVIFSFAADYSESLNLVPPIPFNYLLKVDFSVDEVQGYL